jgi:hypothetical protein
MKALMRTLIVLSVLPIGSLAGAQDTVFFEEQFNGPTLDPSTWRTEILTSGPRWCQATYDFWGPGSWVEEGIGCQGVAAYSPYGSASLSDGWLHMLPTNDRAYPLVASRLPGPAPVFPASGDFTMKLRVCYDRVTGYGSGLAVFQTQSTEPSGENPPWGRSQDVVFELATDSGTGGVGVATALGGSLQEVAIVPGLTDVHEFDLTCVGTSYTISADGQVIFGPVSSALRPTAVAMGNPNIAVWGPTDWTSWSIDYLRVEVHGPTPVADHSWGAIKAMYRDATR